MSEQVQHNSISSRFFTFLFSIRGAISFYLLWSLLWMLSPVGINYDVTDTIQYISIAEKWMQGDLSNAINGYWGPLISWLLIPFLFVFSDQFFAFKILQIIIGALALIETGKMCRNLGLSGNIHTLLIYLFALVYASYALQNSTPDLLLVLLIIAYLNTLLIRPTQYISIGLLGGLMYLCKSFAFPFFLLHISVFFLLRAVNGNREYRQILKLVFVFMLISGSWILMLSKKYDEFTISKSGIYNMALIGPELWHPERKMHPTIFEGLFPPANESASSAWEDPSLYPIKTWDPFSSHQNFRHYIFNIKNNVLSFYYGHIKRQIGAILIITLLIYSIQVFRKKIAADPDLIFMIWTSIIYAGGYMLIFPMNRYLWPVYLLMIIMVFIISDEWIRARKRWKILGFICVFLASFLVIKRAVKEMTFVDDKDLSMDVAIKLIQQPSTELNKIYAEVIDYNKLSKSGDINFLKDKKVVSINHSHSYINTSFLAFKNEFKYYGELNDSLIQQGYAKQLNEFKIDYLLITDTITNPAKFLNTQPQLVFQDEKTGMKIYSLKN